MRIEWQSFKSLGKRATVRRKTIGYVWQGAHETYWNMHNGTGENINGPFPTMDLARNDMIKGFEVWIEKQDAATKKAYGIKEAPVNVVH